VKIFNLDGDEWNEPRDRAAITAADPVLSSSGVAMRLRGRWHKTNAEAGETEADLGATAEKTDADLNREVVRIATRRPLRRLWIGDSHATFLAGTRVRPFDVSSEHEGVVWLGPRLMYSIARDGFPDPLTPELHGVSLDLAPTPIVLVFGEIDCRVHLVERLAAGGSLDFVSRYVARAAELRARVGASHIVLLGPVPPSDQGESNPEFPKNGTLAERIAVARLLERTLSEATASLGDRRVAVAPITSLLAGSETGELAGRLTDDGTHVNPLGADLIRKQLDSAQPARRPR